MRGLMLISAAFALVACDDGTRPARPTKLVVVDVPSEAQTATPVTPAPVVQATDNEGRPAPISGTVTVDVASGNGIVMSGASATIDASGRATFADLTLGTSNGGPGPVSLRFAAQGLEPAFATLTLRCALRALQLNAMAAGRLTIGDCAFTDDRFYNLFEVTTSQPVTQLSLSLHSEFAPRLAVRGPNEPLFYWGFDSFGAISPVFYYVLVPAGKTRIAVTSFDPGRTGSYGVSAETDLEGVPTCEWVMIASPITTTQSLAQGDCRTTDGTYTDQFHIGMPNSARITASMTAQAFAPSLRLDRLGGTTVVTGTGTGTVTLAFTNAAEHQVYVLRATSAAAGGSGSYTLAVNVSYPAATSSVSDVARSIVITRRPLARN